MACMVAFVIAPVQTLFELVWTHSASTKTIKHKNKMIDIFSKKSNMVVATTKTSFSLGKAPYENVLLDPN